MIKQVIVMRKDLNMRKGKMCAQAAHASMKVFFEKMQFIADDEARVCNITPQMKEWMEGIFTKIVVGCNSQNELFDVHEKATNAGIPTALICDSGATEFNGVPTYTCVAVGPADAEDVDKITGGFSLL